MTFRAIVLACLMALAAITATAAEQKADTLHLIPWVDAPGYIQTQVKNVVTSCTEGTLTFDRAKILRYDQPSSPETHHYILDFSAWKGQPMAHDCSYGQLCDAEGCMIIAYTQVADNTWDLALRHNVKSWKVEEAPATEASGAYPYLSFTMGKNNCRASGNTTCTAGITWSGNKFHYIGFGAVVAHPESASQGK